MLLILLFMQSYVFGAQTPDFTTEYCGVRLCDRVTVSDVIIQGGQLYFSQFDFETGGLFRMNKDGSGYEQLVKGEIMNLIAGDTEFFYTKLLVSGNTGVFHFNEAAKTEELLFEADFFDPPLYYKGYFYLSFFGEGFYRLKRDGSEKTKLTNTEFFLPVTATNSIYGWAKDREGDNTQDWKLARFDIATGAIKIFLTGNPGYLTLGKDQIFYSNGTAIFCFNEKEGTNRKLCDEELFDKMFLINKRLYFPEIADGKRIYSVNTEGKDKKSLSPETNCRMLGADAEGIYYYRYHEGSLNFNPGAYVGKYFFDPRKNRERLFKNMPVTPVNVTKGVIYGYVPVLGEGLFALDTLKKSARSLVATNDIKIHFFDKDAVYYVQGYPDSALYKKSLVKDDKPLLLKHGVSTATGVQGRIYYLTTGAAPTLYTMKADGTKEEKLTDDKITVLQADAKFAYLLIPDNGKHTLVQLDIKSKKQLVLKQALQLQDFPILALSQNILYYTDSGKLYAFNISNKKETLLDANLNGFMVNLKITKRYIYYTVDNYGVDGIYRLSKNGKEKIKVVDGEVFGMTFDAGYLYWFSDYGEAMETPERISYAYRITAKD